MSSVLWCALTIATYVACERIARAARDVAFLHPVVTSSLAIIALLVCVRIPYAVYARATAPITLLLIPATIALAVPLYREIPAVRRDTLAVVVAIAAGSAAAAISAVLLARVLGCNPDVVRSLAPKSVTTPVAMAVSAQIGGVPAISAVFAILSGVIGAIAAPFALRRWGPKTAGIAVGTAAHGIGTASLVAMNSSAAAFSGLAMGLNAVMTAVLLPLLARFFLPMLVLVAVALPARASDAPVVLVPLDDRPVTLQLPVMLGAIAGERVDAPPRQLLGNYLRFGAPDALLTWLNVGAPRNARAFVISSDMLAYGGLVASRIPGTTYADAYFRLRALRALRASRPHAWIGVFGTIMRLAPTGIPAVGDAASFFGAYPAWSYLQQYANLHDPPLPGEAALARDLEAEIGQPTLDAYFATRARNYAVDRLLIEEQDAGTIDRLVLGQDDAGPVGLHVREVRALEAYAASSGREGTAIEPGADELGMALVARALANEARWTPKVAIRYSTPSGASYQDPLEFAPVAATLERLITLCGGVHDDLQPDLVLDVRVPQTTAEMDAAFLNQMDDDLRARRPIALADLSFEQSYAAQRSFAQTLLNSGRASHLDSYSSWNTAANTVGTALAEAIAAGAGRRTGTYDALAHRTFTFMRFVDDVDFHVGVRPDLNRWLDAAGVGDHTFLLPAVAAAASARNRALLWNAAQSTLVQLYPGLHIAAMNVTLPWGRTFETAIDVRLAPNIGI